MSFFHETTHTARKQYQCACCSNYLEIGEKYVRWVGLSDGEFSSLAMHPECYEWEKYLNHKHYDPGDYWISLYTFVDDDPDDALDGAPEAVRKRFEVAG